MHDYERWKIKDYEHWAVYLHGNQYFLGRVYIWSKRTGLVDLMDLNADEREELFVAGREVRTALSNAFSPDLFNWASLGNLTAQCHMHVIPRYATMRRFAEVEFIDRRWGKNYAPYDYDFKVDDSVLEKIQGALIVRM